MRCRKPNRLPGYDYSLPGYYYVTICVQDRLPLLARAVNGIILVNEYGKIVKHQWLYLAERYNYITLDEFVVMPDHVHGIVVINEPIVGAGRDLPLHDVYKIKPLHEIIGALKTTSSKQIHTAGCVEFKWQRSFYDRIIRDDKELYFIRNYIRNNPSRYILSSNEGKE